MSPFVRFVFTILVAGMSVNLAIVLVANARSRRQQAARDTQDAARFETLIDEIRGRSRRADIVVESQRIDSRERPLESTLLIRQYRSLVSSQALPLPVVRLVIPGNQLQVSGVLLEFGDTLGAPAADYPILRNAQLVFFDTFSAAGPPSPGTDVATWSYFQRDRVPELVRLDVRNIQPTRFEAGLWLGLWSHLPDPPREAARPWVYQQPKAGLKVTWLKPATIAVQMRHTYTAYVDIDGSVSLGEDQPGMPRLLDAMVSEGERLPQQPPK